MHYGLGLFDSIDTADGASGVKEHVESSESAGALTKIKSKEIRALLERQQYKCALSGRELTPETSSLDHIIPVALGGDHAIYNVQVLHKDVNSAKGSMPQDAFLSMCRDVARWMTADE